MSATKEEMLRVFDNILEIRKQIVIMMGRTDTEAFKKATEAIRALIESSDKAPEVSEEFIRKYRDRIITHFWGNEMDEMGKEFVDDELADMLQEAGVKIKAKEG